jgi:hypothetical protein
MPTDSRNLPNKAPNYLEDHGWKHVTRDHPRPAPESGIFDAPKACCIEINFLWRPHVLGALGALMQRDSWTGDDDEQFRATQEVEKFINRCLQDCEEDCGVYALRQNPVNKCQLQQSLDGGATWTLAFDFSLCRNTVNDTIYVMNVNNTYNQLITNLTNQYDGTVESVAPETVYDSDPDETALRDRALCYAITHAVDIICDMVIAGIEEQQGNTALAALAIGAGVAIFLGYTILTGGLGAIAAFGAFTTAGVTGAGAASALINWASTVISNHSKEPFEDLAARADVACCWYNALKGATVTEAAFADSLTGCTFTGNAQVIRDVIHDANQIEAQFLQFTQLFRQSIAAERAELLPPCPCESYCYLFEFRTANRSFSSSVHLPDDSEWVNTEGWRSVPQPGQFVDIHRVFSGNVTGLMSVDLDVSIVGASAVVVLALYSSGTQIYFDLQSVPAGDSIHHFTSAFPTFDEIVLQASNPGPTGEDWIRAATLNGTGTLPAALTDGEEC